MSQDQYPTVGATYEVDRLSRLLDELLPARTSDKRAVEILHAVLGWAEEIAYEHGEDRFACGEETGYEPAYDRGVQDAREELERAYSNRSDMAQGFAHRFREKGWDVRVFDGAHDDLALEVSEHEAWGLLSLSLGRLA